MVHKYETWESKILRLDSFMSLRKLLHHMFLVVVSVWFKMCDLEVHVTALLNTLMDFQLILYTIVTPNFGFLLPICPISIPVQLLLSYLWIQVWQLHNEILFSDLLKKERVSTIVKGHSFKITKTTNNGKPNDFQ